MQTATLQITATEDQLRRFIQYGLYACDAQIDYRGACAHAMNSIQAGGSAVIVIGGRRAPADAPAAPAAVGCRLTPQH